MSSPSTDREPAPADRAVERRVARAALRTGVLAPVLALVLARLTVMLLEPYRPWGYERVTAFVRTLPALLRAQETKSVVMLGSSRTMYDLAPKLIDAELAARGKRVTSYNFGNAPSTDENQRLMVDELAHKLAPSGVQVDLALVEFSPEWATTVTNDRRPPGINKRGVECTLLDRKTLAARLRIAPEQALRELYYRYAFDCFAPTFITRRLSDMIDDATLIDPSWWPGSRRDATDEKTQESLLLSRLKGAIRQTHVPFRFWTPQNRGYQELVSPAREIYVDEFQPFIHSDANVKTQLDDAIRGSDDVELHFDDKKLDDFIEVVRAFKKCAKKVVAVLLPVDEKWIKRPPEAQARLAAAIEKIRTAGDVEILDLTKIPGVGTEDFVDLEHLNYSTGAPKFSATLADRIADYL